MAEYIEAPAQAELMEHMNAAAATRLGEIATVVVMSEGVNGAGSADDDQDEPDTYPWTDAAYWRADGGPDELGDNPVLDELFTRTPDAAFGSLEDMGRCRLLRHDGRPGGVILQQNSYGQRSAWTTGSDEELSARWQQLRAEHEAYQLATRPGNIGDERGEERLPRIWVCSLADYTAGYLHGEWLDATLEPEELERAVQFILRNSHDANAEEYGICDYNGFGPEVSSLLGVFLAGYFGTTWQ